MILPANEIYLLSGKGDYETAIKLGYLQIDREMQSGKCRNPRWDYQSLRSVDCSFIICEVVTEKLLDDTVMY